MTLVELQGRKIKQIEQYEIRRIIYKGPCQFGS